MDLHSKQQDSQTMMASELESEMEPEVASEMELEMEPQLDQSDQQ